MQKPSPLAVCMTLLGTAVFLYAIRAILLPFVLAITVAYLCSPAVDRFAARVRLPRSWVALPLLAVATAALAVAAGFALPRIGGELSAIAADPRGPLEALASDLLGSAPITLLGYSVSAHDLADQVLEAAQRWIRGGGLLQTLASGVSAVFGLLLTWILLAYFLVDGPRIASSALQLVPPASRAFVIRVGRLLDPVLRRYFIGIALVVLYAAAAAYVGLGLVLGLRHAVLLALLTGILELVPVAGPAASAILGGLAAIQQGSGSGARTSRPDQPAAGDFLLSCRRPPVWVVWCHSGGASRAGDQGRRVAAVRGTVENLT